MQRVHPSERPLLDPADLIVMDPELEDVPGQIFRHFGQEVVGQVEQSEFVHVLERLRVDLRYTIVDQKQSL